MRYDYKQFYRRKLPHRHSPGATLFVTFRLAGSIPKSVLRRWLSEKALRDRQTVKLESDVEFQRRWFSEFEDLLHKAQTGPTWLSDPTVAKIVADSLKYRDDRDYRLHAYSIMSNHGHTLFTPMLNERSLIEIKGSGPLRFESTDPPLPAIMKSLKGYTARQANLHLQRTGQFWEEESYDHEVRNGAEFSRIVRYILNNPVKAGLVAHWSEGPWSYVAPECKPLF